MSWRYYPEPHPTGFMRDTDIRGGEWWTNTLGALEVQLTSETVQDVFGDFMAAYLAHKPLKILFTTELRARLMRIRTHNRDYDELLISQYGHGIELGFYDPDKITSLATDSIMSYYPYEALPQLLKDLMDGAHSQ